MMRIFTISFIVILLSALNAQEIPNKSFEFWSGGDPVDWLTTDVSGFDAVSQSSDAYEGSSSVFMQILDAGTTFVFLPSLQVSDGLGGIGTPVTQRYGSFGGYYKFFPNGNEGFNVQVNMLFNGTIIGSGSFPFGTASNWKEFSVPIVYITGETPDLAILFMFLADFGGQGVVGTNGYVDYVMFGAPTDVEQINGLPEDYSLKQNYPNPFNPSTNIEYSIPEESFVELKVYDVLGNEVASLVNEPQKAGVYRADFTADNLSSGMYFARLTANEFTKIVKMILIK